MPTPIGICTCGNHINEGNLYNLINEYSKDQLKKIMDSEFLNGKIPAPLYENILRSAEKKEFVLLESAGNEYKQPLLELAVMLSSKWKRKDIKVKFLDRSPFLEPLIIQFAKEWEIYANIKFNFVENEDADVRISLLQDFTSWSKLGTECLSVTDQNIPTMNFGWFNQFTDHAEIRRTTLHEFGHVLGCIHEHQSPAGNIPWDESAIRRVYISIQGKDENWIQRNILGRLPINDISNSVYDRHSIMHYPFDEIFTTTGRAYGVNWELSAQDKIFIKSCYPF